MTWDLLKLGLKFLGMFNLSTILTKLLKLLYLQSQIKGFTWSTAVTLENPIVVEDLSESDKPGIDGQEFKVAFNRPFSVTNVITYDHIHNKFQLIVTKEPYKDGDRWVHHLKIDGVAAKKLLSF